MKHERLGPFSPLENNAKQTAKADLWLIYADNEARWRSAKTSLPMNGETSSFPNNRFG